MFSEMAYLGKEVFLVYLGKSLIVLVVGLILMKLILNATRKLLTKTKLDEASHKFFVGVIRVVLWVILIVAILGAFNVSTAPIVTVIGAAGAAIALALKDSLGNVAGGVMIMYNKLFIKDEYIEVAGTAGLVEEIGLFGTTVKTFDNKRVNIPNGLIINSVLTNYSREEDRRVDLTFGISYDTDIDKAKSVLYKVACECEQTDTTIEPLTLVNAHGDSQIELALKVWCKTPDYWDVYYYLMENVKREFDREGIEIPYPQLDIHRR
jgi:small conductance mechanosensitive channel